MIKKPFLIREAGPNDKSILAGLIRDSYRDVAERFNLTLGNCPKHPSNCKDEWIENDLSRGVSFYILEHTGTPAGSVALEKADQDICYLERLAVLPESRRKGFGKALVEHVFARAKQLGAKQINIGIISQQKELKLWYRKIGFAEGITKKFPHLPFLVTFLIYGL
jgi:GNAT superfamily N-acetyltransferase